MYNQVKKVKESKVAEGDNKHKKAPTLKHVHGDQTRSIFCYTQWHRTHEIWPSEKRTLQNVYPIRIFITCERKTIKQMIKWVATSLFDG